MRGIRRVFVITRLTAEIEHTPERIEDGCERRHPTADEVQENVTRRRFEPPIGPALEQTQRELSPFVRDRIEIDRVQYDAEERERVRRCRREPAVDRARDQIRRNQRQEIGLPEIGGRAHAHLNVNSRAHDGVFEIGLRQQALRSCFGETRERLCDGRAHLIGAWITRKTDAEERQRLERDVDRCDVLVTPDTRVDLGFPRDELVHDRARVLLHVGDAFLEHVPRSRQVRGARRALVEPKREVVFGFPRIGG